VGRTQTENVWQKNMERNIWTYGEGNDRRREKTAE
jgi:hypothetical protein